MLLTIFTPTYNRAKLLKRVYRSLQNQTRRDFIWLIVDDGSTDDTEKVVSEFVDEKKIDIEYIKRSNGGKMRAHNTGSIACHTELFLCLDSDDILNPRAVEIICERWEKYVEACDKTKSDKASNREIFDRTQQADTEGNMPKLPAGIVAYKGESHELSLDEIAAMTVENFDNAVVQKKICGFREASFPQKSCELGSSTLRQLYLDGFFGETTLVFRTKLLKEYQFPEIDGEKYVPEDYLYDKIDAVAPLLISDNILTVCELMEGGYTATAAKLRRENPTGWFMYYEQRAQLQMWSVLKVKYISHYLRFCMILRKKPKLSCIELLAGLPGMLLLLIAGKS